MTQGVPGRAAATPTPSPAEKTAYCLHRVACPRCGYVAWVLLPASCRADEIEHIRRWHAQRLLHQPCDRHPH